MSISLPPPEVSLSSDGDSQTTPSPDVLSPQQATKMALAVLAKEPSDLESLLAMARLTAYANKPDDARDWFKKACEVAPSNETILAEFGFFLHSIGETKEAIPYLRRTLQINPHHKKSLTRLALSCQAEGYYEEAERLWARSIATDSKNIESYLNRGILRRIRGHYRDALPDLELACRRLSPTHPQWGHAHTILGMVLLCLGEWQRGWENYESRLTYPGPTLNAIANYQDKIPMWTGEPIEGESLVVLAEQGFGDILQFCRYILALPQLKVPIYFSCYPPLISLMEESFPTLRIINSHTTQIKAKFYIPLLSLPHHLHSLLGDIPYNPPSYLRANSQKVAIFDEKIRAKSQGRRRIGVAWCGNPKYINDKFRSIPAQLMAAVFGLDADFFIVQPECDLSIFHELGIDNLHDLSADIKDFSDTAALMESLDGIISVDTSVVHLAGGLGRPTWLLLPTDSDWRWGIGHNTTPWYPTVRIFRQKTHGDWIPPLLEMSRDLLNWLRCPVDNKGF